jgi:hypothetical protein
MKIFSRLLWLLVILLLAGEIWIYRREVAYQHRLPTPETMAAADPAALVNHYVAWPGAAPAPAFTVATPGFTLEISRAPSRDDLLLYRCRPRGEKLADSDSTGSIAGRLLPLANAPWASLGRKKITAAGECPAAYVLLAGVAPSKTIFRLYLAAILVVILLLAGSLGLAVTGRRQ